MTAAPAFWTTGRLTALAFAGALLATAGAGAAGWLPDLGAKADLALAGEVEGASEEECDHAAKAEAGAHAEAHARKHRTTHQHEHEHEEEEDDEERQRAFALPVQASARVDVDVEVGL